MASVRTAVAGGCTSLAASVVSPAYAEVAPAAAPGVRQGRSAATASAGVALQRQPSVLLAPWIALWQRQPSVLMATEVAGARRAEGERVVRQPSGLPWGVDAPCEEASVLADAEVAVLTGVAAWC